MSAEERAEMGVELWGQDRSPTRGAKPLKKLSAKHRQIIALLLQGYSNNAVAEIFAMTPSRISIIRNDPLVQEVMGRHLNDADQQLGALLPEAVDAVKRGLHSEKHAMKAAEMVLKSAGKFKEDERGSGPATAEDVAAEIIRIRSEGAVDVTIARKEKTTK